jgi:hypothetical protein
MIQVNGRAPTNAEVPGFGWGRNVRAARLEWHEIAEKVGFAALSIFAAYRSIKFFMPAFLAGIFCGLQMQGGSRPGRLNGAACSQGFLARITGVELPQIVSVIADLAAIASHIDHHAFPSIGSATIGLYAGAWAGQQGAKIPEIKQAWAQFRGIVSEVVTSIQQSPEIEEMSRQFSHLIPTAVR